MTLIERLSNLKVWYVRRWRPAPTEHLDAISDAIARCIKARDERSNLRIAQGALAEIERLDGDSLQRATLARDIADLALRQIGRDPLPPSDD